MTIVDLERPQAAPAPRRATSGGTIVRLVAMLAVLFASVALASLVTLSGSVGADVSPTGASGTADWLVPLTRGLFDLAALGTIGTAVAAAWLCRPVAGLLGGSARRLQRASGRWAVLWFLAAGGYFVAITAEVTGSALIPLLRTPSLLAVGARIPQGQALLLVSLVALTTALWASTVRTSRVGRVMAVLVTVGLAPLLGAGHAATASHHFLASVTLLVHVTASVLWVGGLAALVIHLRHDTDALRAAVPRFSSLALACFVAVAVSGVLGAWTRMGTDPATWKSGYGALLVAKTFALVALGAAGWWHRRLTIPALRRGQDRAFARLAFVEVLVLTVAVGLAVVLSRTQPPAEASSQAAPQHASDFPTVDATLDPLSVWTLLTTVRGDALLVTVLFLAAAAYAFSAVRVLLSGSPWPAHQVLSFATGLAVLSWCLVGGVGEYATATLTGFVLQQLTMATVVPVLLVVGAPAPLLAALPAAATRFGGRRRWPVDGVVALVVLVAASYQTPLLELLLPNTAGFVLLSLAPVAVGLLLWAPVLQGDRRSRRARGGELVGPLLVVVALLAFYAWHMRTSGAAYGGSWFVNLGWWWQDSAADQRNASVVMAGFAGALALVSLGLHGRSRVVAEPAAACSEQAAGADQG